METPEITNLPIRDFLNVIFKRKIQILLFFGATVFTVAVGTLMADRIYEATSQILVKIGRVNLYMPTVPTSNNFRPSIRFDPQEQINAEIEILKSPVLAEKVVESMGPRAIYKDLEDKDDGIARASEQTDQAPPLVEKAGLMLQKDLVVEAVKKSNIININFQHTDPYTAASVVNKLVSSYLDRHLQIHKSPQSSKFFKEQSQSLKNKLRQSEESLKTFKRRHNLTSLDEERGLLLGQKTELRAALNGTLSELAETGYRIKHLGQQLAATPKTIAKGEEIDHNPQLISTLQARLVELELKEKELLTKYTDHSRLVQNVKEEIQMFREKLAELETKRYGRKSYGLNVTYQRLQDDLLRNQAELKALKGKNEIQSGQLSDYQEKLEGLDAIEVDLNQLRHQVEMNRQNYQLYLTKFEESRISDAMDAEKIANVSLIQPARPPLKPVSPKVRLNMALAVFLGLFGGLGLAFLLEYLDDSLEKIEDVEKHLELPVLASIPELRR